MGYGERGEKLNSHGVLLVVQFSDDTVDRFHPIIVSSYGSDYFSQYFRSQGTQVRERLTELYAIPPKAHGPRSSREKTDIMNQRMPEIKVLQRKLSVLEGREISPIVIERKEDELIGWTVGDFDEAKKEWWEYVQSNRKLITVCQNSPKNSRILEEAFELRRQMKLGNRTIRDFMEFSRRNLSDNEELDSYVASITNYFVG